MPVEPHETVFGGQPEETGVIRRHAFDAVLRQAVLIREMFYGVR
jgi:hypothetical protein